MIRAAHQHIFLTSALFCLAVNPAHAQGQFHTPFDLSIKPRLLNSEFVPDGSRQLGEARLGSGVELNLDSSLLALNVDYRLQGVLREADAAPVSQQVSARLQSALLNGLLGVDAGIRADTVLRQGADTYRYRITPGVSRSLNGLANVSVNYDYLLDKPARQQLAQESRGYSMVLDGSLQGGRLAWRGSYRSGSVFQDRLVLTRATQNLDFKSSYRIGHSVQVELFSALRQETRFRGVASEDLTQKHYGAALAWSPSARYALAFRLSTLEQDWHDRRDTVGSGTLSWFPSRDLELTFDYGEQVAAGLSGWMVRTRFDIEG